MTEFFASLSRAIGQVLFWVMVEPWEQAIRVRAGKRVRRLGPGFHWRIPVLDVVYKQTVRLRSSLIPTQTLTVRDGGTIVVGAILAYSIGDIEKLYRGVHHAEDTITQLGATMIAQHVATATREQLSPGWLATAATNDAAAALAAFGLQGVQIRITDFAFIRAFRLLQEGRWASGKSLSVERPS